jgi:hypothetical protein
MPKFLICIQGFGYLRKEGGIKAREFVYDLDMYEVRTAVVCDARQAEPAKPRRRSPLFFPLLH